MTYKLFFKLALAAAVIVISYLVFSKPNYSQSFAHMDKVGHFGSFFSLAILTHLAFKPRWFTMVGILACYAILIEVIQSHLPYRSASMGDVAADLAGIAAFFIISWLRHKYKASIRRKAASAKESDS
ncbi:VanZ family protein [Shewanella sp. SR44-3]|uniref:VanZ family protein n=1 Tax=unclassified Shewanella TaxID=196818 RepID=UPI0015F97215|nr:VanZ family protein [Shewanella sp. SR44-3]MBB1268563.1 VanZ family protein [Shewanella sp. SR44-3]